MNNVYLHIETVGGKVYTFKLSLDKASAARKMLTDGRDDQTLILQVDNPEQVFAFRVGNICAMWTSLEAGK